MDDLLKVKPQDAEKTLVCLGDNEHPPCPIFEWCMDHVFEPDTCEESVKQYQLEHERGNI